MNPLNNPVFVDKASPLLCMILLEWANVSQMIRMWTEGTAEGQSLIGWSSVSLALLLWLNFYRYKLGRRSTAYIATVIGWFMNAAVILTVIWFRYYAG